MLAVVKPAVDANFAFSDTSARAFPLLRCKTLDFIPLYDPSSPQLN